MLHYVAGSLTRALGDREERIKEFVLAVRSKVSRCQGRSGPKLCADDVLKETPLPEFKLDLATIVSILKPRRKLRPRRKQV